ncbi:MAG: NfeD family protein [Candidatus Fermentibacteraceae bacterium]|nr:NfeD family protein [Candidatus Fermentibacteraceae bacterium]MBN2609103.1 NfeD family protein [Candidatus Fermentibacteraceae bacterium]
MIAYWVDATVNVVPLVITGGAVLLILGLIQLFLGLKAQRSPGVTGERAMIGETGVVRKAAGFRQRCIVEIRGELWWCVPAAAGTVLGEGATVKVVDITADSMILKVDTVE